MAIGGLALSFRKLISRDRVACILLFRITFKKMANHVLVSYISCHVQAITLLVFFAVREPCCRYRRAAGTLDWHFGVNMLRVTGASIAYNQNCV